MTLAADIILLGNLHVTQSRSQSDEVFNNAAINRLNQALSKLAKKKMCIRDRYLKKAMQS